METVVDWKEVIFLILARDASYNQAVSSPTNGRPYYTNQPVKGLIAWEPIGVDQRLALYLEDCRTNYEALGKDI